MRQTIACLSLLAAAAPARAAGDLAGALKEIVIRGAEGAGGVGVYVDFLGKPVRGKLVGAADEGMTVEAMGCEMNVPWEEMSPARLASTAGKLAASGSDHLKIARYLVASSLPEKAREACERAVEADATLSEEADDILGSLRKDEEKKTADLSKILAVYAPERKEMTKRPARRSREGKGPFRSSDVPDLSKLPPHPRLWVTGEKRHPKVPCVAELARRSGRWGRGLAGRALSYLLKGDKGALEDVRKRLGRRRGGGDPWVVLEMALAYDWIAGGLDAEERRRLAGVLIDSAGASGTENRSYRSPLDNNTYRWMLPWGAAALAVGDEDPRAQEMFEEAFPGACAFVEFTGDHLPELGDEKGYALYGGGWPEGYDYDRIGTRHMLPFLFALRSATGLDAFDGSRFCRDKIYNFIYGTLPNRTFMLGIEDNDHPNVLSWHDRQIVTMLTGETGNGHGATYLRSWNRDHYGDMTALIEFVLGDPGVKPRPMEDLPTGRLFEGIGLALMRSDWGEDATYVSLQSGDHFCYHENNAENAFTIFRRAPLAVDSGVYDGRVHDHYENYSIRSIAHNTVLVHDPGEKFRATRAVENDGGQTILNWKGWCFAPDRATWLKEKLPLADKAEILAFETTRQYDYAAGEAGRAYRRGKVPYFSRQIVLAKPDWVVCFDRVTSGNASHRKTWLLHAEEKLEELAEGRFLVTAGPKTPGATGTGNLVVHGLLPRGARGEIIGGPGKEYFYGGKNHPGRAPYNRQTGGRFRLEIAAPSAKTTYFLVAMYAPPKGHSGAYPGAEVTEETGASVTVRLGGRFVLTFQKTGPVGMEFSM